MLPAKHLGRLRAAHDVFFVDDRVLPMLPRLLGSDFFKANKLPMPVDVTKSDLRALLERCVGGAILRPTRGTCASFCVGHSGQKPGVVAENISVAAEAAVKRLAGHWSNVQSVHVRAPNTVSLPLYASL